MGVKFYFTNKPNLDVYRPHNSLRYCEWINKAMGMSRGVLLNEGSISCPAAKEILGFMRCEECVRGECIKELVQEGRFTSEETASKALIAIPRMRRRPRYIALSPHMISPDVYVFYLCTKHFMLIAQAYQRIEGDELRLEISSVMPVCGNCTVRPYVTDQICASFGCLDSREHGGITEDKFVVGLPC